MVCQQDAEHMYIISGKLHAHYAGCISVMFKLSSTLLLLTAFAPALLYCKGL